MGVACSTGDCLQLGNVLIANLPSVDVLFAWGSVMRLSNLLLGSALAAAFSVSAQAATLTNAGFETGDLSGWTFTSGYVSVETDADDAIGSPPFGEHFTATEGNYFANLIAGESSGVYTTLSQAFTLTTASRLSFDAAFLAFDYLPYDDDGYVRIFSTTSNQVVFASSISAVGDQGHTSWARFTSSTLDIGDYVLEAGVRNIDDPDPRYSSQLLLDNVSLAEAPTTVVPEPATWALMIGGFGMAGAMLRRRRALAA